MCVSDTNINKWGENWWRGMKKDRSYRSVVTNSNPLYQATEKIKLKCELICINLHCMSCNVTISHRHSVMWKLKWCYKLQDALNFSQDQWSIYSIYLSCIRQSYFVGGIEIIMKSPQSGSLIHTKPVCGYSRPHAARKVWIISLMGIWCHWGIVQQTKARS